ncbi:MAG: deoxyribose-phosphate aldolase [Candidatus Latescibacterota bacterium]|nr:MAG: deoxyribose-phosphate aldolase [Candidatus Latescibacterota bacterium]
MTAWDKNLSKIIDHTILKPDATETDIRRVCSETRQYRFAAVVVPPCYVPLAVSELGGSGVPVCSVVSFPLGWEPLDVKLKQTERLLSLGADEIDMVMNVSGFLSGQMSLVEKEIAEIASLCSDGAILKVIIETAYLDHDQIALAAQLGVEAGANIIKTSTGFGPRGASVDDVRIIKSAVSDRAGIKAAGGIRTKPQAQALVEAGATRLGCSTSVSLISEGKSVGSSG